MGGVRHVPEAIRRWALDQCAMVHPTSDQSVELTLITGAVLPCWFWVAVADGRIEITNAQFGQLNWGRDGLDVHGPNGTFHVEVGETLKRSDVA